MAVAFEPGAVIAGRYRLSHLIGQGGMGVVWAATDTRSQKAVALKHLRTEAAADPETRRRFLREVQATSVIVHPNIVAIHDIAKTPDGLPVLVMDQLNGEPLGALLSRQRRLSIERTADILAPVASAVGTAHSLGIIHRDLKPENIFLCRDEGGGTSVKVLDFGIAKVTTTAPDPSGSNVITGTWSLLGTPYYMSPEQIIGERDIDHRSDIWALGVILYECLAGVRPSEEKTAGKIFEVILLKGIRPITEIAPSVPAEVAALIGRMLSRERADRPTDLREVFDVLARYTRHRAPRFGPPAPAQLSNAGELSMPKRARDDDDDDPLDFGPEDPRGSALSEPPATQPAPSFADAAEAIRRESSERLRASSPSQDAASSRSSAHSRSTQPAPLSEPASAPDRAWAIRLGIVVAALAAGAAIGTWILR